MSPTPLEPSPSKLDQLSLSYLNTIDTYQSQITILSTRLSAGYLSLAQANYHAPNSTRYGPDFYDERMSAMYGVDIEVREGEVEENIKFGLKKIELPEEVEEDVAEGGEKRKDSSSTYGLRRRKAGKQAQSEEEQQGKQKEGEEEVPPPPPPTIDHRDPIRWFGILVPPALRASQSEFRSSKPPRPIPSNTH
jgi:hypothetical protein